MIRAVGSVLIAAGAAWWGLCAAAGLKKQVRALEELVTGIALLEHELSLGAPELAQLMTCLSRRSRGAAKRLFGGYARALGRLGERSAAALWEETVSQLELLPPEGKTALVPLGEVLGRYDCREQSAAAAAVRARLDSLWQREQESIRLRCRTCQTVALSGGAFLIILLL